MVKSYACKRCGHEFKDPTHLRDHLKRMRPCDPVLEDLPLDDLLRQHEATVRAYRRQRPVNQTNNINNPTHCTIIGNQNNYYNLVPHMKEEDHGYTVPISDIMRAARLPLEEAMREYVRLRNFTHPRTMNIASVLNDRARRVNDFYQWEPDSTRRCAQSLLRSFMIRLKDGVEASGAPRDSLVHADFLQFEDALLPDHQGRAMSLPMILAIERALYAESVKWFPKGLRGLPAVAAATFATGGVFSSSQ